jgi:type IV pilus assembly protein PilY1
MKISNLIHPQSRLIFLSLLLGSSFVSHNVSSAPGELVDRPLSVSANVTPNIMFLLDDSGSMFFERLISVAGQNIYSVHPDGRNPIPDRFLPLQYPPTSNIELDDLCLGHNLLAYNPNIRYEPWSGVDEDGNEYQTRTLTTALFNPYFGNDDDDTDFDVNDNVDDVSNHIYMEWIDDGDNVFEVGECGTLADLNATATPGAFATYNIGGNNGDTTNDDAGYLTDSGGVNNNYGNNEGGSLNDPDSHLSFIIDPPGNNHNFTLDFLQFGVEAQATCSFDRFSIDQRASSTDPWTLVSGNCGNSIASPMSINGVDQIRIRFYSDFSVTEPGFLLFWNHADSGETTPAFGATDCGTSANCTAVADLPTAAAVSSNVVNTQENYANWYTYYRKRDYIAKKAMSDIIDINENRMGMATLWNRGSVGTIIREMSDETNLVNGRTNRQELMDNLFRVTPGNGTPLRQNLQHIGRYFLHGDTPPYLGSGDGAGYGQCFNSGEDCDLFGQDVSGAHATDPNQANIGYAASQSSDSPIYHLENGGVCQQNFAVVFSDGLWNGGNPVYVDNQDNDTGSIYAGGSFSDDQTRTLADVAMLYLKNDISSGDGVFPNAGANALPNNSQVRDVRIADQLIPHQHMTTYTVAFGLTGTLNGNPANANTSFAWPNPIDAEDNDRIDDMRHAAWNGRGLFLNAEDPQGLIRTLNTAISDIDNRSGTATAASVSSGFISSETLIFQSRFDTNGWAGDLLAFQFDENGVINRDTDSDIVGDHDNDPTTPPQIIAVIDEDDAVWNAAENLAAASHLSRRVFTFNGNEGLSFDIGAVASYPTLLASPATFATGRLSDFQIEELLSNAPHDINNITPLTSDEEDDNQAYLNNIVNYILGDPSLEIDNTGNGIFRNRQGSKLGAIINSSAQYVGPPNDIYPDSIEPDSEYSEFVENNANRRPVVYVGSNGGMLHAFDSSLSVNSDGDIEASGTAGDEIFAYMPSNMFENSIGDYGSENYSYQAFVDATPTVRDVFIPHQGTDQWRTLLVGGLRSGGRGIYILDVTDPVNFSAANVLAEFTHEELGFTYGRPQIVKMNNGRWAAIFGNGYNSPGCNDPLGTPTHCGEAKLFILYLDGLANGIDETDYEILRTSTNMSALVDAGTGQNQLVANDSCLDANSDCNGLSAPAVADLDGNFTVDRVYAGDVHGQLWVFNLEDDDSSNWEVGFNGEPLFTACSSSTCTPGLPAPAGGAPGTATGTRQSITVQPQIALHPSRRSASTSPNVLVYFSTGQYISIDDATSNDTAIQSMYGVWDAGYTSGNTVNGSLTKSDLQQQLFQGGSLSTPTVSSNIVSYTTGVGGNYGWYINFELSDGGSGPSSNILSGTRSYINPVLSGRVIFFVGTQPTSSDPCNPDGDSFLVALDSFDGTQAGFNIFDSDGDGEADNSVAIQQLDASIVGLESVGADPTLVGTETDGGISTDDISVNISIAAGRKSWTIIK